jgi:hypothetical protein
MNSAPATKVVGQRRRRTPAESLQLAWELQSFAESRSRFPKPRGFVFKARTWEDYAEWRRRQNNPRLW